MIELRSDDLLKKYLLNRDIILYIKYFKNTTIDYMINNCNFSAKLSYKYYKYNKQNIEIMKNIINNSDLYNEPKQEYLDNIRSPINHTFFDKNQYNY